MATPSHTATPARLPEQDSHDPRVKRTRALIEEAFANLLTEKSLQSITVSDITRLATINRATFYAHFQDKYELHDQLIAKSFRELLSSRLSNTCSFNRANLLILISTIQDYLSDHMRHCKVPSSQADFHASVFQQVHRQVHLLVNHWLASMGAEDATATAAMFSWAVLGAGIHGNEKKNNGEELDCDQAVNFLAHGLAGMGMAFPES